MYNIKEFNETATYKYPNDLHVKTSIFVVVTSILIAIILGLVVTTVILADNRTSYRNNLENIYEQSFYDLISGINDIEIKLDKVTVATTNAYRQELLTDIWKNAELMENNLARLSGQDAVIEKTAKYINQLGDFSLHLANKLNYGGLLTDSDMASIDSLYNVSVSIGFELNSLRDRLGSDFLLIDSIGNDNSSYASSFNDIEETSIDYPELIYDGPFADSRKAVTPKGIVGSTITEEEGLTLVKNMFPDSASTIHFASKSISKYEVYNYATDDNMISIQMTTTGQLISYTCFGTPEGDFDLTENECNILAKEFLDSCGYSGMEPVWYSIYYGKLYINYVPSESNVLLYGDLIKVKVDMSNGKVIGFEGINYIMNHISRSIASPAISQGTALAKINGQMNVLKVRLTLIPEDSTEVLAYEIFGSIKDNKYFIYVNATTGEEINVLRVIDSENGSLLL